MTDEVSGVWPKSWMDKEVHPWPNHCLESDRTTPATAPAPAVSVSRTPAGAAAGRLDGHPVCAANGHPVGVPPPGDGLRLGDDLLAAAAGLAEGRGVGEDSPRPAGPTPGSWQDRLVQGRGRQRQCPRRFWGAKTGPNPTDRRKLGSKHHLLTDAQGIPLAFVLTGANRHDVTQLLPLVDAVPPVAGKVGHPRRRPDQVQGDRAYDSHWHRQQLRQRHIRPVLAERNTENGSGLGIYRWVVERSLSWIHQHRRLRIRHERRDDIHEAFMTLGCILICHRCLNGSLC